MLPPLFKKIVDYLDALPEVGPRQAWRLSFWLLRQDKAFLKGLIETLIVLKDEVHPCPICYFPTISKGRSCDICRHKERDATTLCVVARETDLVTIEGAKKYNGRYFVLGGLLIPFDDQTIIKERLQKLKERLVNDRQLKNLILALPTTREAAPTIQALEKILATQTSLTVRRPRRGMPRGGEIEFLDPETLVDALF